jgi:ubiquinone/menaquinone biosynthesis C-methylase UbiE
MTADLKNRVDAVRKGYDRAAAKYTAQFFHEVDHKPFDRDLLSRFARLVKPGGKVFDIGCGPGHAARELASLGLDVTGIDISDAMITQARALSPDIEFRVGDMFSLDVPDRTAAGITALYAIVNFPSDQAVQIFEQFARVLKPDGIALIAFHVGEGKRTVDHFMDEDVTLDFFFHNVDLVLTALSEAGLKSFETIIRYPYDVEYPTQRAYLWVHPEPRKGAI